MTLSISSSFHCPLHSGMDDFLGTVFSSSRSSVTRSRPSDGAKRTLSSQLALTGIGPVDVSVAPVGVEGAGVVGVELGLPLPKPKKRADSGDESFGGA